MNNYLSHFLIAFEPALWVAIGVLTFVFWAALIVAIIIGSRDKQLRKQAGEEEMEYVPEHPYISRLASREEIEALRVRSGMSVPNGNGCENEN